MLIGRALPLVKEFIERVNAGLAELEPGQELSGLQKLWLEFCLMGIIVTGSLCWSKFKRASLGQHSEGKLSWMFRKANIAWKLLLRVSVRVIIEEYGIVEGMLAIDDTDRRRSKRTTRIGFTHKIKDKKTNGYFNGQNILFVILVTESVTIPVDFDFYVPDPVLRQWRKQDKKLKKQGVPSSQRPKAPARDPRYPTKQVLALRLLQRFRAHHPEIRIKLVVADALYGCAEFLDQAQAIFGAQVISQVRKDQLIQFRNRKIHLTDYFNRINKGVVQKLRLRGSKEKVALVSSARLYLQAHKKKRFIIALRYEGESEYRYLVASDLSWRTIDIVQGYSLRWLVEVFIEDWKLYEGWGQLAKQFDEDGSRRGLILSLLLDLCLLLHPQQTARIKDKLPAATVGSLLERLRMQSLLQSVEALVKEQDRTKKLSELAEVIEDCFPLNPSKKHLHGLEVGQLEPAPSLKYHAQRALEAA